MMDNKEWLLKSAVILATTAALSLIGLPLVSIYFAAHFYHIAPLLLFAFFASSVAFSNAIISKLFPAYADKTSTLQEDDLHDRVEKLEKEMADKHGKKGQQFLDKLHKVLDFKGDYSTDKTPLSENAQKKCLYFEALALPAIIKERNVSNRALLENTTLSAARDARKLNVRMQ